MHLNVGKHVGKRGEARGEALRLDSLEAEEATNHLSWRLEEG